MNAPTSELRHRYPGSRPFLQADTDLFFGRSREIRDLSNLVMVEKLVVLFSRSGAGKTSLLKAGAEPVFLKNGFVPIHFRLNKKQLSPEAIFETTFRDFYATWSGSLDINEALGGSFWELVKQMPFQKEGKTLVPVFILDQFEEFFYTWGSFSDREPFIKRLAELLSDRVPESLHAHLKSGLEAGAFTSEAVTELEKPPPFRLLISMRNDTLHFLDEMTQAIPVILRSRFQLFPIKFAEAREAILRPASLPGVFASEEFSYSPDSLEEIMDVLGSGGEIEPYRLQLFCAEIEDRLIAQKTECGFLVSPAFYKSREGIAGMLEGFYEKQLAILRPSQKMMLARQVIEMELLTATGKRQSVVEEELMQNSGISRDLLLELEGLRLLRSETRLDSLYYEITHDTIVPPIWKARRIAEERQRQALVTKQEADNLANSLRAEELAHNRKSKYRAWRFAAAASILLCLLGGMYQKTENALKKATINENLFKEADSKRLLAEAQKLLSEAALFEKGDEPDFAAQKIEHARAQLQMALEKDPANYDARKLQLDLGVDR